MYGSMVLYVFAGHFSLGGAKNDLQEEQIRGVRKS
jgi:hypothetical protein